ncbi:sialidase family protein [Ideonella sp.]|uniref:sialidase family protein n=1 Tax=Ideonella sp. TaxID=1929293 RepID=UPI0035AF4630
MYRWMSSGLLVAAGALQGPCFAQAEARCDGSPCVSKDVELSPAWADRTSIAVDTADANRIVIGYDDGHCYSGALQVSPDGGQTWRHLCTLPGNADDEGSTEAPAVAFDRDGAVVAALPYFWSDGGKLRAMRSTNGQQWDGGSTTIAYRHFYDSGWIKSAHLEADAGADSPYRGRLYASFTDDGMSKAVIRVGRSEDGIAWRTVDATPTTIGDERVDFSDLAIGRDGSLHLSYLSCVGAGHDCHGRPAELRLVRSADGGQTWTSPTTLALTTLPPGEVVHRLWYDYGALPGTTAFMSFTPVIAVDASRGPHQDRLYAAMTTYTDKHLQVLLSTSDDRGASWRTPTPVATGPRAADQFMPWVSVSHQGVVAVTWMDQRKHPKQTGYQPMVAFSTDGGTTFTAPGVLQGRTSDPAALGDLDSIASHAWAGKRLKTVFVGPDAADAKTLRLSTARP